MKSQDLVLNSIIQIDNKEYLVKDKIIVDRIKFYLLINTKNKNDVLLRKTNELTLLKDDKEFDRIYRLFNQRNAF